MRGTRVLMISALVLSVVPGAAAQQQKKFKDEGLQQYLVPEITAIQAKLDKLTEKLASLETEIGKIKEQQAMLAEDHRRTQDLMKATDTSVTSLRVSNQQDLLGVKTDLVQIRRDITEIADVLHRGAAGQTPAAASNPTAPAPVPTADGYVTQVSDTEVTINLGSSAGVRVGMRFSVYHGADPQTRIGIIEVTDVMDANNSRARILETKPEAKFQFSDVVRPL